MSKDSVETPFLRISKVTTSPTVFISLDRLFVRYPCQRVGLIADKNRQMPTKSIYLFVVFFFFFFLAISYKILFQVKSSKVYLKSVWFIQQVNISLKLFLSTI